VKQRVEGKIRCIKGGQFGLIPAVTKLVPTTIFPLAKFLFDANWPATCIAHLEAYRSTRDKLWGKEVVEALLVPQGRPTLVNDQTHAYTKGEIYPWQMAH
jgi:hypothetical protein